MITLLTKLFIKNSEEVSRPEVREKYGVLCGAVGIFLNILLFAGKFLAGLITKSIAVTADAFNNLSDAGSSAMTMIGFRLAGKKPDPDHPFGHGRIEYVTGLIISFAILLMGFELVKSSVDDFLHPAKVEASILSIVILAASVLVKLYMAFYNRSIAKKIDSAAMKATATDSLSDMVSTLVVLASIIVSRFTDAHFDCYVGLLVAGFILLSGFKSAKETIQPLLGNAPSKEFVDRVEQIVMSHKVICGIHDLVVHDYGPGRVMISLHAEVPADGNLFEMHDVIDNIEHDLSRDLNCEAIIHMDPIDVNNAELAGLRTLALEAGKTVDEAVTVHDFRMVPGETHTNLIFDVVVPFTCKLSDAEIRKTIFEYVKSKRPHHYCVMQIDRPYV